MDAAQYDNQINRCSSRSAVVASASFPAQSGKPPPLYAGKMIYGWGSSVRNICDPRGLTP
ncbi:hypothetical protein CHH92_00685 [Bacillus sonorensis]|nr:hypothetical protein CHH92_00685 [Bacillus sonorensis]RHJ13745.1 hypothetical protein DW143_03895 [Bacillus sonorensis]